jgi:hypothetical protein
MSRSYTIPVNQKSIANITIGVAGGGGISGPIYTTAGTAWANPSSGTIQIKGDAVFEGKIKWMDRDMQEWFESVEARLGMLQPNPALEAEWDELAEIRRQYVELEQKLLEKQRVFDILKKS